MTHTTKKDLTTHLKPLSKATLKLIAVEVGCVVHRHGSASNEASAPQLADFLMRSPIPARRAVQLLRASSKDPAHHQLATTIEGIKGCGPMTIGRWTLTPTPEGVHATSTAERYYICHSTDHRVGMIVLDTPDATHAIQLAASPLPRSVQAALDLLLGPPPTLKLPKKKAA